MFVHGFGRTVFKPFLLNKVAAREKNKAYRLFRYAIGVCRSFMVYSHSRVLVYLR